MKAAEHIAIFLEAKGIDHVFELSGGMITHILDAIHLRTAIKIVSMHHEQSAAFAAEGYARVSGKPGVALATSGPGATNLLTGIGSCYFDSTPCIFITGQVNRHELKSSKNIRQLGFQETDIVTMSKPVTKASFQVHDADSLPFILEEAYRISMTGRPGPVLIDIPMDIQRADCKQTDQPTPEAAPANIHEHLIKQLIEDIRYSKKPLILAGRGVRASASETLFLELASTANIPVVSSLLGLDLLDYEHPQRVGFIGSYGNRWANIALGSCDLLLVIGARLDIRQTGADTKFFEHRKIYHVDCEPEEINNRIKGCVPIVSDVKAFLHQFLRVSSGVSFEPKTEWKSSIQALKEKYPDIDECKTDGINPNQFIHTLSHHSKNAAAYIADVGSHQMWAAQSLEIQYGQYFLTSGGMGAMGFALPAAIGASFALKEVPVVVLVGDGCMQINIQELQTIVRNQLPVKMIVFNNRSLGMIRQFQDSYFNARYQSTYWGYSAPDFEHVASAYGIVSKTISSEDQVSDAMTWLWQAESRQQPKLLQVMIDPKVNAYPKIAFGQPITEMEPFVKPSDMEST